MKLIDAIQKVDLSDRNSTSADYDDFCRLLGIQDYSGWNETFDNRIKGYYVIKWLCTDSWVGLVAYYMDSTPIAISTQTGRKSDKNYQFISKEAAEKVRQFILSIMEEEDPPSFELIDPNEEIGEFYDVQFSGQLLTDKGLVDGKPCEVINKFREDYIAQKVTVRFEDGSEKTIATKDFKIPYHLRERDAR